MDVNAKKVLYISYDGMTDQLGQSQVIPYLRELTKFGYSFTLLSVEKKERMEKSGEKIRALLQAAGIRWETISFTRRPPLLAKLYDQWRLNRTAARLHKARSFELVHCRSYVSAQAGLQLHRRYGIPFLFDMRGFWVDERVDSGLWNLKSPLFGFLYKRYKKKEKRYLEQSTHIISLTQRGKEELEKKYHVPADRISVIPCCADLDHFDFHRLGTGERKHTRESLSIGPGQRVLSYLGSLGGWYMTEEMLDFFAVMKEKVPGAVFLLITHDAPGPILARAAERGISPAEIRVQPASRDEVPKYLSISDWNIFFIRDVYSKKASSPTKQGEVMAMGLPLICNDIGDTGDIVEKSGAGIVVRSFDRLGYENICTQLPALLSISREKIRSAAEKYFDLQHGVKMYRLIYEKLCTQ